MHRSSQHNATLKGETVTTYSYKTYWDLLDNFADIVTHVFFFKAFIAPATTLRDQSICSKLNGTLHIM